MPQECSIPAEEVRRTLTIVDEALKEGQITQRLQDAMDENWEAYVDDLVDEKGAESDRFDFHLFLGHMADAAEQGQQLDEADIQSYLQWSASSKGG